MMMSKKQKEDRLEQVESIEMMGNVFGFESIDRKHIRKALDIYGDYDPEVTLRCALELHYAGRHNGTSLVQAHLAKAKESPAWGAWASADALKGVYGALMQAAGRLSPEQVDALAEEIKALIASRVEQTEQG